MIEFEKLYKLMGKIQVDNSGRQEFSKFTQTSCSVLGDNCFRLSSGEVNHHFLAIILFYGEA